MATTTGTKVGMKVTATPITPTPSTRMEVALHTLTPTDMTMIPVAQRGFRSRLKAMPPKVPPYVRNTCG